MDARKKKVLIVLGVASLILVWRVAGIVSRYMPSTAQAVQSADVSEPANIDLAASVAQRARRQQATVLIETQARAAEQPWGRDPFANVVAPLEAPAMVVPETKDVSEAPNPPPLSFTGVARVENEWRAIVSGRFIGVGDIIEADYRVSEITKRSITFQSRGWSLRYELGMEAPVVQPLSEKP